MKKNDYKMLGEDDGAKVCECGNSWLLLGKECIYIYIYTHLIPFC